MGNFSAYSFIRPMAMEGSNNKALVQAENCFEAEASFYDLLTTGVMLQVADCKLQVASCRLQVAGYRLHWIG